MNKSDLFVQGFNLKENITVELLTTKIPLKWIEFFRNYLYSFKNGRPNKLVKTTSLRQLIYSISPSIIYCNDLYTKEADPCLLISTEPIDYEYIIYAIQVWGKTQINKIKDLDTKEEFIQWLDELSIDDLESTQRENVILLKGGIDQTNGKIFDMIPKLLALELVSKNIEINNQELCFKIGMRNGKSYLYSFPKLLSNKLKNREDYYSICIEFNLQTVPSESKYKLLYTSKVSRWIGKSISYDYLSSNDITVFKVLSKTQFFTLAVTKENNEYKWLKESYDLYQKYFMNHELPDAKEWINNPQKYQEECGLYGLYHAQMGGGITTVESGLTMNDKWNLYKEIKRLGTDWIERIEGLQSKKATLFNIEKIDDLESELKKITGRNHINIEIYAHSNSKLVEMIKEEIKQLLKVEKDFPHYVSVKEIYNPSILSELDDSVKEAERHQLRITEIKEQIPLTNDLTAAFVLLPYKDIETGKNYFTQSQDPKKAIRSGLACQGRLTQFIDDRLVGINANQNRKKKKDENDTLHRIQSAVSDMVRQLGFIPRITPTRKNEKFSQLLVTGLHVVNFKKTPYGNLERMALFVTFDPQLGKLLVECPALWKGAKLYWEAALMFQKLATIEMHQNLSRTRIGQDIKQKVLNLTHEKRDNLLIVDSNGVTRYYWALLTNKTLETIDKTSRYTIKELMFDKENSTPLSEHSNLRIIRTRMNSEVFDYLTRQKEDGNCMVKSGVFTLGEMYYSIGARPNDPLFKNTYQKKSKLDKPSMQCKAPDMIELYPIHLKAEDDPHQWISYIYKYRQVAIQYKDTLRNTLILHLAMKLEEYIY